MFSGCCAPGDEPGESVRQLSDMLQDQQVCKLLRRVSECLKHLKTLADFRKKYENLAEQLTPNSQPSPEFVFLRLVQFLSDTEWYKGLCGVYVWSMCGLCVVYVSIYVYMVHTFFQARAAEASHLGGPVGWLVNSNGKHDITNITWKNMKILF